MNALNYAINMELAGEKYYREQAEINKNNELYSVCLMLAEDEKHHALIFKNKLNEMDYELEDSKTLSRAKNIFESKKNDIIGNKEIPSQLEFYRIALLKEKQSIDLYNGYLSKAVRVQDRKIFEYLIEQEKQHCEILEELALLLNQAEEWVESAEFGLRKEY